jgi:L-threonylcarbamoyladenylate synthase
VKVDPVTPGKREIEEAAGIIRRGGLVVFPTETVYGLAANLLDEKSVERLYEVKRRPRGKPLTIHIADMSAVRDMASGISEGAMRLMERFWPGPLTIVLDSKGGGKTGFRMPSNKVALELIKASGVPVVAPSANRSGDKAPRDIKEVLDSLDGEVDMILDAGPTERGIESTVVDATAGEFEVLREKAIKRRELEEAWHG